ncbi:MAG: hypothetical protein IKS17_01425 [Firmicutes bacterium]|nr:hypothetical protein [Bacillota bacterium]
MAKGAMAMECPRCGGEMQFDPTLDKLKCIYCDSTFTVEEVEAAFAEKEQKTIERSSGSEEESGDMKSYTCSNCSAELMTDANTAVMRCPYCGNSTVAPSQFEGSLRPDVIIPFGFTKEQLITNYKAYYQKRFLVPKSFINNNKIEEIQGVYVPFWLYSGKADVDAEYEGREETEKGDTKTIKYYDVKRKGTLDFENVPADASKRMPNDLMDSIEPYNFEGCKKFSITYLPGFLAERYDETADENRKRTEERVKNTTSQKTRATTDYDEMDVVHEKINVTYDADKYAMLPVWYFTSKWGDKNYSFAMNGQTGKLIGDLPISVPKMLFTGLIAFLIPFLICYFALSSAAAGVIFGIIAALITMYAGYANTKPVVRATSAFNYIKEDIKLSVKEDEYVKTVTEKIKKD